MQRPSRTLLLAAALLPAGACRRQPTRGPAAPESASARDDTPEPAVKPLPRGRPDDPRAKSTRAGKATRSAGAGEPERLAGITAAHNRVRARLQIDRLTWSPELAQFAQAWADKLQQQGCKLKHRPHAGPDGQRYGENLYAITGAAATPAAVVHAWAAEAKHYDARTHHCKLLCGHYTQVVWRASRRLGCGVATCGDTEVWVCNYDPRGNDQGQRPY